MSTDLSRKKKMRGGHRGSVTQTMGIVDELMELEELQALARHEAKLKQLRTTLQEKLQLLQTLDEEILDLVSDDEIEKEIQEADRLRGNIQLYQLRIEEKLKFISSETEPKANQNKKTTTTQKSQETPLADVDECPSENGDHSTNSDKQGATNPEVNTEVSPKIPHSSNDPNQAPSPGIQIVPDPSVLQLHTPTIQAPRVKLPKLDLKGFKGDLSKWQAFWDTYEASIHNNPTLAPIDKFNYLISLLQGPASDAIAGLAITNANYMEAIEILQKRFGNKQQIINRHMELIINLNSVRSGYQVKELRQLYDTIESHVRSLKSLGVPSSSYGTLLSSIVMNKLPQELKLLINREVKGDEMELERLLRVFEAELEARERAGTHASQTRTPTAGHSNRTARLPTAATLVSGTPSSNPNTITCSYCKQAHTSNSCNVVTDIAERKRTLMRSGRCFVCLRRGHISKECKSKGNCNKCKGLHHVSICSQNSSSAQSQAQDKPTGNPPSGTSTQNKPTSNPGSHSTPSAQMYVNTGTPILLQTAQAQVSGENSTVSMNVRIILDGGSQRSYVSDKVKSALNLPVEKMESMVIQAFGSASENPIDCPLVKLNIETQDGEKVNLAAYSVPLICTPVVKQTVQDAQEKYEHLANLKMADPISGYDDAEIDLLIGSDQYWNLVTGCVIKGKSGPTAIHTRLGWVLSGPMEEDVSQDTRATVNLVQQTHALRINTCNVNSECDLRAFWDLETLGIMPQAEKSVYDEFVDTISYKNGRYEVHLPWKDPRPNLPDNYDHSLKRLNGLLKRLRQEPDMLHEYDAVIKDQVEKGIVEIVNDAEPCEEGKVHYLPHHPVIRRDKSTTKLRVVYDASCKSTGPSLNDCLYTGPAMSQRIMDIILRFRAHKLALVGDIEKAFLNIAVAEEDRDVLRFLWIDDVTKDTPNIIVLRFTRVVFGVTSSPFLLNATLNFHLERYRQQDPDFVDTVTRATYVDDVSTGGETVEQTYELYLKSKVRLAEGGFNLRKFATNSAELRQRIEENEADIDGRMKSVSASETQVSSSDYSSGEPKLNEVNSDKDTTEHKILGVQWDFEGDHFIYDLNSLGTYANDLEPTKRNIAAVAAKFYDPLGFLSPVTVQIKILLQDICATKIGWDDELNDELKQRWKKLVETLLNSPKILLDRCYFSKVTEQVLSCSYHGFCDASNKAYAAVVYLQVRTTTGTYVRFMGSKTRVAPLETQSIPRLELLSALILARLITTIIKALEREVQADSITCWTDSTVALYWITQVEKEWKQFVQNRVREIRALVSAQSWRHCPGIENPADIPSRGMSATQLVSCSMWRHGPLWLSGSIQELAPQGGGPSVEPPAECLEEVVVTEQAGRVALVALTGQRNRIGEVVECERFSSLQRLLRVTALVIKFITILKSRIKVKRKEQESTRVLRSTSREIRKDEEVKDITEADLKEAELRWIKEAQSNMTENHRYKYWKQEFGVFTDEQGILRCGGRISNANLPYGTKHPILLDANHDFSILLIKDCHQRVMHNGVKDTLTELRARFWIVKGRNTVRRVIHDCTICRRMEGRPYNAPSSPPLPDARVKESPPFTHTGIDLLGPLHVSEGKKKPSYKVWICLYTCCVTRAIHLDVVPNMTPEAFVRSMRRFTARRGLPTKIISDNGTTFQAASKMLKKLMKDPKVRRYLAEQRIEWSFNLPKSPWWGGFFERLVKSTKRCLKKTMGRTSLTYEELLTIVTEVEAILNSRPLSYVTVDDIEEPLTPSHLICGRRLLNLPDSTEKGTQDDDQEVSTSDLSRRMKHLSNLMNHFWLRWRNEYLLELREVHRHSAKKRGKADAVKTGDVVIVHDDDQPRGLWRLGRIERLIVGSDNQVRGAVVKVKTKKRKPTFLKRPVQKLYPLEINDDEEEQ